jgi:Mg-chelatase subunit ChlD
LAKSGQALVDESPAISSVNEPESPEPGGVPASDSTPPMARAVQSGEASSEPAPSEPEILNLIRLATVGNAAAQVDLGNLFFSGRGRPMNKPAAEYWWGKAALQGHEAAVQNLHILHTKPEEGVSFFGTLSKGKRFVFVIDKSGSMNNQGRLAKAKRELIATLRSLKPDTRFMVYFFDHGAEPMPATAMMAATPKNVASAARWIEGRNVGGSTDPSDALRFTFNLKPDTVWLLTDGQFADEDKVLSQIREANSQAAIRINTVAFKDKSGEAVLKQIAAENDGNYRFVQN